MASKDLTECWRSAEAARPVEWNIMGVVRGPCQADPAIRGDGWVAWVRGPKEERVEGKAGSPQDALLDLANQLRRLVDE